ncbi:MAG TPA: hypothetical protein DCP11_15895 [Microbacteriaceae bacterium]|nr:hypothetical protein [Microbacteriaceae bacterium]
MQVVVATDGEENSSHEWTADAVRHVVQEQTSAFGWDFVFLGANQDAVLAGGRLGFHPDKSMTYEAAPAGVAGLSVGLNVPEEVPFRSRRRVHFPAAEGCRGGEVAPTGWKSLRGGNEGR